jgi:hypothetical protein
MMNNNQGGISTLGKRGEMLTYIINKGVKGAIIAKSHVTS